MGSSGEWTGGRSVLIQTGDIVDRGDQSALIFEALFRLQDEAPRSGGQVILMLGNHELMNMQNDFRYATGQDTRDILKVGSPASSSRAQAFSRQGWPGMAIRQRMQGMALVGTQQGLTQPVLFVHAGLLPEFVDQQCQGTCSGSKVVEGLNDKVRKLLDQPADKLRIEGSPLFADEGPFWTRELALGNEKSACQEVQQTLKKIGATRMVVGHTPQIDGHVHSRCGGRLLLADTFISDSYTGVSHPSALEFYEDGSATAIYPQTGKRVQLPLMQTTFLN